MRPSGPVPPPAGPDVEQRPGDERRRLGAEVGLVHPDAVERLGQHALELDAVEVLEQAGGERRRRPRPGRPTASALAPGVSTTYRSGSSTPCDMLSPSTRLK